MATQNRHLTPKKTTLDEAIATDIAINIIAIQYLKFFLKKLSKNVATCLTLTALAASACFAEASRFAPMAAAEDETESFMAVISSAILESESVRADVSAESLMVLSFILKLLKIKKDLVRDPLCIFMNF